MHQCRVPGCTAQATRWGTLCSTHKSRQRRHGHPMQRGVTKAELAPYLATIRRRKDRNPDSPLWANIEARWDALVEHCRSVVRAYLSGRAMNGNERQACQEIVNVADHVAAERVIETALALFLMHEQDHRRFVSRDGFRHQLSRRIRGLADVNAGTWFDHKCGKVKRFYRDLPALSTVVMGAMLAETFGAPGLLLARREEQDAEKRRRANDELAQAVEELL